VPTTVVDEDDIDLAQQELTLLLLTVTLRLAVRLPQATLNPKEGQNRLLEQTQTVFRVCLKHEQVVEFQTAHGNRQSDGLLNQFNHILIVLVQYSDNKFTTGPRLLEPSPHEVAHLQNRLVVTLLTLQNKGVVLLIEVEINPPSTLLRNAPNTAVGTLTVPAHQLAFALLHRRDIALLVNRQRSTELHEGLVVVLVQHEDNPASVEVLGHVVLGFLNCAVDVLQSFGVHTQEEVNYRTVVIDMRALARTQTLLHNLQNTDEGLSV
jgi:hypothetical protein